MLAVFAEEILYNHGENDLQPFSLWCIIQFWLVNLLINQLSIEERQYITLVVRLT